MMMIGESRGQPPTEVQAAMGYPDLVRHVICREKAKRFPRTPVSLFELELLYEWTTTGDAGPEDFLIHDSGPDTGSDRILVFSSPSALNHLASADTSTVPSRTMECQHPENVWRLSHQ